MMDISNLPTCVECGHKLRPARTKKEDWPGTVSRATKAKCTTCYNRNYKRGALPDKKSFEAIAELPCVLVRVYLTPSAFRELNQAHVDIAKVLSDIASEMARLAAAARKQAS